MKLKLECSFCRLHPSSLHNHDSGSTTYFNLSTTHLHIKRELTLKYYSSINKVSCFTMKGCTQSQTALALASAKLASFLNSSIHASILRQIHIQFGVFECGLKIKRTPTSCTLDPKSPNDSSASHYRSLHNNSKSLSQNHTEPNI